MEKKADLEKLLNLLWEKWLRLWGKCEYYNSVIFNYDRVTREITIDGVPRKFSLRELVSKESWLWQFVCDNKLYNRHAYVRLTSVEWFNDEFCHNDCQFRLIESALCDEDKLEDFILSNVKIDEK